MTRRRLFLQSAALCTIGTALRPALAHHGWASFDDSKPLYIVGRAKTVQWKNPHAEIVVTMAADAQLPAGLAQQAVPAQSSPVDGPRILGATALPPRRGDWTLELAPMARINAWKIPEPKVGDTVAAVGYSLKDGKEPGMLRVEYLVVGGQWYGLRSSPA